MVMKTYLKSLFRSFKKNISRFISITMIVLIGSIFISGFGTLTHTIEASLSEEFIAYHGADILFKSKNPNGFSIEEIEEICSDADIKGIKKVTCIDIEDSRFIISNMSDNTYNTFELVEGKMINDKNQILSDRLLPEMNEMIRFYNMDFEVVGTIKNPLIYSKSKEWNNNAEEIKHYYYLDSNYFDMASILPITDLYISMNFDSEYSIFSNTYREKVDCLQDKLEEKYDAIAFTYNESVSYQLVINYSDKINVLCIIFPIFFLLVSCLVVLSTMTRLIEEERGQMGCYLSLGFSKKMVLSHYLLFSFSCCFIGSFMGLFIGVWGIPPLLYNVFNTIYFLPPISESRNMLLGIIGIIVTILLVLLVSSYVVLKELKDKPCELLKIKTPKAGKKIWIEKINVIWSKLKFKYKSTLRNVFRYKKNLMMTVISVSGSTALVLAGCGLYHIAISDSSNIPESMEMSFATISSIIILFAGILCMLVIYNLMNMNIGEREREISSLKVLGYQDIEVSMYIYREIFIMTLFGVILGLPFGYGLLCFLIEFIGFGSHKDITLSCYILTILLVFLFVIIVDIVMHKKIKKIDMNKALKTNE